LTVYTILTRDTSIRSAGIFGQILKAVVMRPTPLILLAMSIFYLWVYLRRDPARVSTAEPGEPGKMPLAPTQT
jgi:hypothetical protein